MDREITHKHCKQEQESRTWAYSLYPQSQVSIPLPIFFSFKQDTQISSKCTWGSHRDLEELERKGKG
jgi:hypothetical protein